MATRMRATLPTPFGPQPRSLARPVSVTRRPRTRVCVTREIGGMRSAQPLRMPLENVGPVPFEDWLDPPPPPPPEEDEDEPTSPAARPALAFVKHAVLPVCAEK